MRFAEGNLESKGGENDDSNVYCCNVIRYGSLPHGGSNMEIVGFVLFILGAAGMDSTGKWFYVAAGCILVGLLLMYTGEIIKDHVNWKRKANRRKYGNFN